MKETEIFFSEFTVISLISRLTKWTANCPQFSDYEPGGKTLRPDPSLEPFRQLLLVQARRTAQRKPWTLV